MRMRLALSLTALLVADPLAARGTVEHRKADPALFHSETGYRIDKQRAPTPDDIPGPAKVVTAVEARSLIEDGALPLDVSAAAQSRYDELSGTWLVSEPRMSLPGAVWLPETGRGTLTDEMQTYLAQELAVSSGSLDRAIVVFCVADCWMSWNAAQRIASLGYTEVHWFPLGTDGWIENGWPLYPVEPRPVAVD